MTTSRLSLTISALVLAAVVFVGAPARAQDCEGATASVTELWPPNHQYVPVTISVPGAANVTVISVTQDEPLNGLGDGDTCPDAEIIPGGANLRAERSGTGNGRVYVITFTATAPTGTPCRGRVTVCVPHDRKPGHTCTDDGQTVDSLGPCQ